MSTAIPYRDVKEWWALFVSAPDKDTRRAVARALPRPLSPAWVPVVEDALAHLRTTSHASVVPVLEGRLAGAEDPHADPRTLTHATCTGPCGERLPMARFGLRYMVRANRPAAGFVVGEPGGIDPRRPLKGGVPRPPLSTFLLLQRQTWCSECRALPDAPVGLGE